MKASPLFALWLLLTGCATPLSQTPPAGMPARVAAPEIRAGDNWTYALHDGYTRQPKGTLDYQVSAVQGDTVTVRLLQAGHESIQRYTRDGNWRERPMTNLQNFRYEPAYAALPFPLEAGKSWQAYVNATDPATGRTYRVRIDGKIVGWERVRVPAGEFDAIVMRRLVYAGNDDAFRGEENIAEYDWYAPGLGGIVKQASASGYHDKRLSCDGIACDAWVKNDWNVAELTAYHRAP